MLQPFADHASTLTEMPPALAQAFAGFARAVRQEHHLRESLRQFAHGYYAAIGPEIIRLAQAEARLAGEALPEHWAAELVESVQREARAHRQEVDQRFRRIAKSIHPDHAHGDVAHQDAAQDLKRLRLLRDGRDVGGLIVLEAELSLRRLKAHWRHAPVAGRIAAALTQAAANHHRRMQALAESDLFALMERAEEAAACGQDWLAQVRRHIRAQERQLSAA